MKKTSTFIIACFSMISSFGQGSSGLVAHWDFNGNANDVSGNNLNGVVTGAVQTTGYNNIANTAYKFKGRAPGVNVFDNINIPYDSLMNSTKFSICALVRPDSFYSKICETSSILWRDHEDNADSYNLLLSDNFHDGACGVYTPAYELFSTEIGNMHTIVPLSAREYNGYVSLNTWYCIVSTFDGDTQKIYINGALKKTIPFHYVLQPRPIPIVIGAIGGSAIDSNATWPYPFYGSIDDIRLYNRDLNATEANEYCDSVKMNTSDMGVAIVSPAKAAMTLWPNPAHNTVTVRISGTSGNSDVRLFNSLGQLVSEQQISGNTAQLNLTDQPAGVYIIKINCDGQLLISKLYKQ